jgi:hypothetical protein
MVAELGHPFGRITMTVYEMRTYTLQLLTAAPWGPHP